MCVFWLGSSSLMEGGRLALGGSVGSDLGHFGKDGARWSIKL